MFWYVLATIGVVLLGFVVAIIKISNHSDSHKQKVESIYEKEHRERMEKKREWNKRVAHWTALASDLVPHDDPEYDKKVREMAEYFATEEMEIDNELEMAQPLHENEPTVVSTELPF